MSLLNVSRVWVTVLVERTTSHCIISCIKVMLTFLTSISDSLDLVDIKVIDDGVEAGVEVIQKFNNLQWSATTGNLCKPNNITGEEKWRQYGG